MANVLVLAIITIAILGALFYTFIFPLLSKTNPEKKNPMYKSGQPTLFSKRHGGYVRIVGGRKYPDGRARLDFNDGTSHTIFPHEITTIDIFQTCFGSESPMLCYTDEFENAKNWNTEIKERAWSPTQDNRPVAHRSETEGRHPGRPVERVPPNLGTEQNRIRHQVGTYHYPNKGEYWKLESDYNWNAIERRLTQITDFAKQRNSGGDPTVTTNF